MSRPDTLVDGPSSRLSALLPAPMYPESPGVAESGVSSRSRVIGLVVAIVVLLVVVALSFVLGARAIPFSTVVDALVHGSNGSFDATIVLGERAPRTVAGLIAGVGLAVAGALMQALTRNPLADPGILGVNAGSSFVVALAVALLAISPANYLWFAFAGAFAAAVVVYLIGAGGSRAAGPVRLMLAGLALGAVLSGITGAMLLANPDGFQAIKAFQAGVLSGRPWSQLVPAVPFVALGVAIALLLGRALGMVSLGDDAATAAGVNVRRTRVWTVLAITLLAGAATAVAGPINFIGLMVPHAARRIVGANQRWLVAYCLVLGPILLLSADIVARLLLARGEVPAGVVTAVIGAPVLIWLARRSTVRGL